MGEPNRRGPLFVSDGVGKGLRISGKVPDAISHEVMFEEDVTHIKDRAYFLGPALPRRRFYVAGALVFLLVCALLGRAFWMQVVQHAQYRDRAEQNRLRVERVVARRGIIRDRNGTVLAENIPAFNLEMVPWLLPRDSNECDELLGKVGRVVGKSLDDLHAVIASSTDPTETVVLMRDVPYDRAISVKILTGENPALRIVTGSKRRYPLSTELPSFSHILGYVGAVSPEDLASHAAGEYRQTDTIGKAGAEVAFEPLLRGVPGKRVYEVNAFNTVTSLVEDQLPADGTDIRLTIDAGIQRAAEQVLRKEMEVAHIHRAALVAMDPRDGSVLALVSLPAYDDNFFSGTVSSTYFAGLLADPDVPLLARAWAGSYPSGSTIKPVIATAALEEHVITANTTVFSVGGIHIGSAFFPDWKAGGHGIVNVRKAIAWSVNTFFYYVGGGYGQFVGLGMDRLSTWMRKFGLGTRTGFDLPGEHPGFVPSKEWKQKAKGERWYVGDTYNLSIGQGDLLVTPLQIAMTTAEIANGGFSVRPHVGPLDLTNVSSTVGNRVADAYDVSVVRNGMRDTVAYGSGRSLSSLPFKVAGKTGTAQWRNDRPNHGWFTSFAPFDSPEIVVTVLMEEGVEGSVTAAPVAKEVLQAWWQQRAPQNPKTP